MELRSPKVQQETVSGVTVTLSLLVYDLGYRTLVDFCFLLSIEKTRKERGIKEQKMVRVSQNQDGAGSDLPNTLNLIH